MLRILSTIEETTALTAYRIVQEGLTNVFRHSGATRVTVRIERTTAPSMLRVKMRDNGVGLGAGTREGMGLRGMSERVAAIGGRLTLESARNPSGAILLALLPLDFTPIEDDGAGMLTLALEDHQIRVKRLGKQAP